MNLTANVKLIILTLHPPPILHKISLHLVLVKFKLLMNHAYDWTKFYTFVDLREIKLNMSVNELKIELPLK